MWFILRYKSTVTQLLGNYILGKKEDGKKTMLAAFYFYIFTGAFML